MSEVNLDENEKAIIEEIEHLNKTARNQSELEGIDPLPLNFVLYKGNWKSSKGFGGQIQISAKKFDKAVKKDYVGLSVIIYDGFFTSKEIRIPAPIHLNAQEHYPKFEFISHTVDGPLRDNHKVTYTIRSIEPDQTIKGDYVSINPGDKGSFKVKRSSDTFINSRRSHDRCSIA